MVKKPPCPVCRSKRWRKNSSGFYVCEFGHQLEGYQELVSEYDGTGGSTYLRKINRPKRKRKVKENVIEFLSGRDLEFYNVQALQLILRKQIHVMVHEIGCPAELEYVAHEYWTLYLSMQQRFKNSWQDDDTTNGPESGPEKGNDGTGGGDEEEEEDDVGQASGQDPSSKETQPQSFKDKSDQPEEEPDDLDNMDEYQRNESSSSESEANSEDDDEESTSDATDREAVATDNEDSTPDSIVAPRKRKLFSRPRDRKLGFTMQATIAICYLSAQHLKLPIVMGDFYRWIMDRTIPYYNAEQYVPQEMRGKARNSILFPKHRGTAVFYKATSDLTNQLYKTFGLVPRTPNVPPMVFRFVQELMLPVEVFPCAMRLYYIFHDKVAVQGRTMFQNYVNRDRSLNDPLVAMAVVILIAKLFYGLDGKKRSEGNASSWINSLPQETDWLQSQDVYDSFKTQTKIPALMGEFEELIQVNPDLYTAYCERELTPYARVGYKKIQVLRPVLSVFESTKYGDLTLDDFDHRPTPEIESFIRHLHANVPRPEDREDWKEMESVPPPLRPGEGYVHYIDEPSGEFLGRYKRLLSYGANILCLTTEEMQDHVRRVEEATVCETVLAPGHLVEAENMDYLQQQAASAQRRSSHKK